MEYVSTHRLRQAGFTPTQISANAALPKIKEASAILSSILGQWFVPIRNVKQLDGHGSSIMYLPNRIPFLEVLSLGEMYTASATGEDLPARIDILLGSGDRTTYNPDEYTIRGRIVELLYSNFYAGRNNVLIDCYTGLMDWFDTDSRNVTIRKVIGELNGAINHDAVECVLQSTEGFRVRDVVLFESNDTSRTLLGTVIVNETDHANKKLKFNKLKTLNEAAIPTGSRVLTFGAVPLLIERATLLLFKKLMYGVNTDEYEDAMFGTKLRSEKTDRYSYTLFGGKDGGGIGITGDPLIDSQLGKFSEPNHVDLV